MIAAKKEINTELEEAVQEVGGAEECDKNGMMATIHNHLHGEMQKYSDCVERSRRKNRNKL